MFYVARRQQLNLEPSTLKEAMIETLTATREVGREASSGEALMYEGMDPDLARHLVEAAYQVDDGKEIEAQINRAAEVMQRGDSYLLDAEAELQRMQPVPMQITASWQLDGMSADRREADELRREAAAGNPVINPAPDLGDTGNGQDRRTAIRSALGGTRVVSARGNLRN
jgi:hypothetical protein